MAFYIVSQPRKTMYRPPAWQTEYDPFDLFSEFIGHHPTSLLGYPGLTFGPSLLFQTTPQQKPVGEQKWHKVVKLPPYFGSDDFTVKTEGNTLFINAKHEDKDEEGSVDLVQVTRKVVVPEQVDMDSVKTLWLKRGGILVVGEMKPQEKPAVKDQAKDKAALKQDSKAVEHKEEGFEDGQISIDPQNFVSEMISFVQDVHEALFGQSLKEENPEGETPMETKVAKKKEEPAAKATEKNEGPQEVKFDVSGYKPDEVKVSVNGHTVNVEARHVNEEENHMSVYEFRRSFTLPPNTMPEKVTHKVDPEKNTLVITIPTEKQALEYQK